MSKPKWQKGDEHIRVYNIPAPRLDRTSDQPRFDCQHEDASPLFFTPDEYETPATALDRELAAKQICAACPFAVDCALHALEFEDYGIWGGLTERDRGALGGRGIGTRGGRTASPESLARRLMKDGLPRTTVAGIFRRWGRRRRVLHDDNHGEVA